jgi:hypothetical protein
LIHSVLLVADLRGAKDTARRDGCADFCHYDIPKKEFFQWNFLHKPGVYTLFIKNMEEKVEKFHWKKKKELSFLIFRDSG